MATSTKTPICTIVTPIGLLGYGIQEKLVNEELSRLKHEPVPLALILDSGSTDSGALKLCTGATTVPRTNYVRDLTKLVKMVVKHHIPLLIGSAGGDGSNDHVDMLVKIVEEIFATMERLKPLKVIRIYSEIDKALISQRLEQSRITGCGKAVPTLKQDDIDSAPRIVSQMGSEPYLDAMFANEDFDVIIGGRAYDPAPYVAYASYCFLKAHDNDRCMLDARILGNILHSAQILECGGTCSIPKSASAVARIYEESFLAYPLQAGSVCTPLSVAAHTLYEKSRPDLLFGPGGYLDLTQTTYEQDMDGKSVHVRGAVFNKTEYTVKLEGGKISGYRAMYVGSFADLVLIQQLNDFLARVRVYVEQQHHDVEESWQLYFHRYGDGPGPVCIIGEALADTQALALSVVSIARIASTHGPYPMQIASAGNMGFSIAGPPELETGPCAIFCIYHLMTLDAGEERGAPKGSKDTNSLFRWVVDEFAVTTAHASADLLAITKASEPPKTPIPQYDPAPMNFLNLRGIAQVIRSKNAGPYEITIDTIFQHQWCYQLVKESNLLSRETICRLFSIEDEEDIIYLGFFDQAKAFKVTFARRRAGKLVPSGGFMEDDVHGSQRYIPLLSLEIPPNLRSQLEAASHTFKDSDSVHGEETTDEQAELADDVAELQVGDNSQVDIPTLRIIRGSVSA